MKTFLARAAGWLIPALLAVLLALAVVALGREFNAGVNSDHLYLVALCHDLLPGGHGPEGWHVPAAPYLFPDVPLLLPWVRLFSDLAFVFLAYALAFHALLLAAAVWVGRQAGLGWRAAYLAAASGQLLLLAAHLDPSWLGEGFLLYYPGSHAGAVLIGLALLGLVLRGLRRGWRWPAAAAFVLLAGPAAASDRLLLAQFLAPLCVALPALSLLGVMRWRAAAVPLGLVGLSVLLGRAVVAGLKAWPGLLFLSLMSDKGVAGRAQMTAMLRTVAQEACRHPVYVAVVAAYAVLSAAALLAARRAAGPRETGRAAAALMGLACCAGNLAAMLLVSGGASPEVMRCSLRYGLAMGVLPFLLLGVLAASSPRPWLRWCADKSAWLVSAFALLAVGGAFYRTRDLPFRQPYPELARVVDRLSRERGYCHGLAGFWNSRRLSLLSREYARVRPIIGRGVPYFHASNPNAFLTADPDDLTFPDYHFIVVSTSGDPEASLKDLQPDLVRAEYGTPDETVRAGADEVWVYHQPLCSRKFREVLAALLARKYQRRGYAGPLTPPRLAHSKRNLQAGGRGAERAGPGGALDVRFAGPQSGRAVDLSCRCTAGCEMTFYRGDEPLGALAVPPCGWVGMGYAYGLARRLLPVPAAARGWDRVVLRAEGRAPLVVGHLLVYDKAPPPTAPLPQRPARLRFEAESLLLEHGPQADRAADPAASGGWARRAGPGFVGPVVRGPYLDVGPGRYRADFTLRLGGAAPPGPVAELVVWTCQACRELARQTLTAEDFAGGYRTFSLDLDGPYGLNDLDMGVNALGTAEVWVDCVDLVRVAPGGPAAAARP